MTRAVVAMIKGGLGNQLFAYAAARAYAIRTRRELWLDDVSGFTRDGYGRCFNWASSPSPPSSPRRAGASATRKACAPKAIRSFNKLLPNPIPLPRRGKRQAGRPAHRLHSNRQIVRLNGYWQSEIYFAD